jgi:hypothetical protein
VELPIRYADNGDGTLTDSRTGLMWEKKVSDTTNDYGNPEGYRNFYTWSTNEPLADGTVFTDFLLRVNGFLCDVPSTCAGLGGHSDWRLPSLDELQTIVDNSAVGCGLSHACIDPAFGPTLFNPYWTSTTNTDTPNDAWLVDFVDGSDVDNDKASGLFGVRAVRGTR